MLTAVEHMMLFVFESLKRLAALREGNSTLIDLSSTPKYIMRVEQREGGASACQLCVGL